MKNKLLLWFASIMALLGLFLILVSVLYDIASGGISYSIFGPKQAIAAIVGLLIVASSYWFYRYRTGTFTVQDIPVGLFTVSVFVALLLVIKNLATLNHVVPLMREVDNRLHEVEALANRPGRRQSECGLAQSDAEPDIDLRPVVSGLTKPVYVTHSGDGSGRLFVVEKAGTIRIVKDGVLLKEPFLDIREHVLSEESVPTEGWERGFLGVAFHPAYAVNGRFFVNYTALEDGRTVVAEYRARPESDIADSNSESIILEVPQPHQWHNGGQLQFGPDGYLYIGLGDGGGVGDPWKNGQNLQTLLGKILRIDIDGAIPYDIPLDNPFVERKNVRSEIFAYGLRNPWRFSFDRCDGSLLVGDVGQHLWEEVNLVIKGGNYGWPIMEGERCFSSPRCNKSGLEYPIHVYGHNKSGGVSVIGGYVYRGHQLPELTGHYVFADLAGRLWSLIETPEHATRWKRQTLLDLGFLVSSFGEGEDGELYLTDYSSGVLYRLESIPNP